ncbi:hypothetical protein [Cecembia lonarensis]|uniref:hypothetical protein n=1 Tax=Cecembia lonarensis TaxID=645110 RepID=UPI0012F8B231|nr:hypothetical protein [Cecembia lonarensis]
MKTYQFLIYLAIGIAVFFLIRPFTLSISLNETSYVMSYSMPWAVLWMLLGLMLLIMKQKNRAV